MKELYLWEIEFSVHGMFQTDREIKVVTEKDSYGEAERVFLSIVESQLKDSNFEFSHIINIKPSISIYAEEVQK